MKSFSRGHISLGIYWAVAGMADAHNAPTGAENEIQLITSLDMVKINWAETFRSRFDYSLGDEENEIQLISGSKIDYVEIYVNGVKINSSRLSITA
jgi:hypothetical protein